MKESKLPWKQQWFVICQLVSRETKRRYSRSKLGIIWSVLNPLLTMAVMSVLFTQMFRRSIENYPLYLLTGNMIWQLFSGGTNAAMTSIVDNRTLLLKIKISKETFPLSRIYSAAVNFLYTFLAYLVVLLCFGSSLNLTMLLAPAIILCLLLFTTGLGYLLAVIYVFFGDIKHLYSVILTLWMYLSAIFYPVSEIPKAVQPLIQENPLYLYIQSMRECMLYKTVPEPGIWLRMLLWGVIIFLAGRWVFRKKENQMMLAI